MLPSAAEVRPRGKTLTVNAARKFGLAHTQHHSHTVAADGVGSPHKFCLLAAPKIHKIHTHTVFMASTGRVHSTAPVKVQSKSAGFLTAAADCGI